MNASVDLYAGRMLQRDAESELVARAHAGDRRAVERLIVAHMPLVYRTTRRLRGRGDYDDVLQEGRVGLLIALERFEPERGLRFATYAAFWIRARVNSYLVRACLVSPLTSREGRRVFHLLPAAERALRAARREPDAHALAERLGVDPQLVAAIVQPGTNPQVDSLPADEPLPEQAAELSVRAARVAEVLDSLSHRERTIAIGRLVRGDTLAAVGRELGLSRERARQLERVVIARLRELLAELNR
jgi:RNA polymerase sigma-32 factor